MGKKSIGYRITIRIPEGKKPVRRLKFRCKWEYNNKMDLKHLDLPGL
jgi:hypothetical protein